jgi:hypothetical protein
MQILVLQKRVDFSMSPCSHHNYHNSTANLLELTRLKEYLHRVEFVSVKQSACIEFRVTCKLIYKSRDNVFLLPRVVKLTRTTVGSLKDIWHLIVQGVVERMVDGVGNCRLA